MATVPILISIDHRPSALLVWPATPPVWNLALLGAEFGVNEVEVTDPVDAATGLFRLTKTDLVLPGRLPIALTRTFRGGTTRVGAFGVGGSHQFDLFLVPPTPGLLSQLVLSRPNGVRHTFAVQPTGVLVNTTDPAMQGAVVTLSGTNRVLTFKDKTVWTFDGNGRLISQQDRNGNTLTITRDGQGRVTQLTEPAGRSITFSYAGTSLQVSSVTDPIGRTIQYGYDANNRLTSVTDPAGGVTRHTYDANNNLLTITDPRNITFLTNEYDTQGRVCRQTQADGGVWLLYYVTSDAAGTGPGQQLLAEAAAGGSVTTPPCTVLGTAPTVLATVTVDPRGNPTTQRFNSNGYLIAQTDALGQTTQFDRANGTNLLLSTTDPLGRVTRFTYDASGNVTSITDPAGNVRTFTYEPTFNKVTSITDPLGNLTSFEYDAQGNLIAVTDPLQNTKPEAERLKTRVTYNQFGQPVSTTDPLGNVTTFAYDAQGDLITIADPLGDTTQRTYDLVSRLIAQTDPRGKTTRFAYDQLNRITQIVDALNGVTAFGYDGNGNLLTVTDARGSVTTHTYDSMDRLATRTDPLNRSESFVYDSNGNLTQFTDRKAQLSSFTYDALNRRTRSDFADATFTEFSYDAAGRLIRASDSQTGAIVEEYDVLDRLIRETTSQGSIQYAYDALGRRSQMTVDGQAPVSYSYDAKSRLTQITQASQTVTIGVDPLDRRTLLILPNGTSAKYQYDAASRLTALIYRDNTGLLGDLTYAYDQAGGRVAIGGSLARTLLPEPVLPATYDSANQQLIFGNKSMTFDQNGNLTSIADPIGTTTFTWDARNRLRAISGLNLTANFTYDVFDRRVQKSTNGVAAQYQYDGFNIILEAVNGTEVSYFRTLNLDEVLSRGGTEFYLADALGSTIVLAGPTGGTATTYTYEPFGRTASGGVFSANAFQFTGRENDGTGLYYLRARYYHPELARFLSEDPIGMAGGLHLYQYGLSNPLRFYDPLGLKGTFAIGGSLQGGLLARVAFLQQGALVIDTKGNVGLYKTTLPSGNTGFEGVTTCLICASGAGFVQLSNAEDIFALAGPFETASATANVAASPLGPFVGVELDKSSEVQAITFLGGASATYPQLPFSVTGVKTNTEVVRLFNIFDELKAIQKALGLAPLAGAASLSERK